MKLTIKNQKENPVLKRTEGYHPREIFTIGLAGFIFGITLLLRTCIESNLNTIFLVISGIMVITYCIWIKPIPIINQINMFNTVKKSFDKYPFLKISSITKRAPPPEMMMIPIRLRDH